MNERSTHKSCYELNVEKLMPTGIILNYLRDTWACFEKINRFIEIV